MICQEKTLPSSFYAAIIILMPKPEKDIIRKEKLKTITLINTDAKSTRKYYQTEFSNI